MGRGSPREGFSSPRSSLGTMSTWNHNDSEIKIIVKINVSQSLTSKHVDCKFFKLQNPCRQQKILRLKQVGPCSRSYNLPSGCMARL